MNPRVIFPKDNFFDKLASFNPSNKELCDLIKKDHIEIINYFSQLDDSDKLCLLKYVIWQYDLALFCKLYQSSNIDITYNDNELLRTAATLGAGNIILYLAKNGENITFDDNYIFRVIIGKVNIEILEALVDYGCNIHADKEHALKTICASYYQMEKLTFLVRMGADIHIDDDYPLILACQCMNNDIAIYLIDSGANIHTNDEYPLRLSIECSNVELIKYLINAGADTTKISIDNIINCIDNGSYRSHPGYYTSDTIRLLLEHNIDLSSLNKITKKKNDCYELINVLVSGGVEPLVIANLLTGNLIRPKN
jgi:hypothetical protein